jgi:hypothetical protein
MEARPACVGGHPIMVDEDRAPDKPVLARRR